MPAAIASHQKIYRRTFHAARLPNNNKLQIKNRNSEILLPTCCMLRNNQYANFGTCTATSFVDQSLPVQQRLRALAPVAHQSIKDRNSLMEHPGGSQIPGASADFVSSMGAVASGIAFLAPPNSCHSACAGHLNHLPNFTAISLPVPLS